LIVGFRFQSWLASVGAIEVVVAALNNHRQAVALQEMGCFALRNISALSANQASEIFFFLAFFVCFEWSCNSA
jgi:hypothetical protein